MLILGLLVGSYLLGSVPVGYLVARAKGVDILGFGSGNIGATNIHRALGKWLGLMVFFLDVLKGLIPSVVAAIVLKSQEWAFAAGMAAVAGHCLSPFLKFKGGKGIATGLGAMLGSSPLVAGSAFGVFLLTLAVSRFVSLSSIVAALTIVPLGFYFKAPTPLVWAFGGLTFFIIYRHRANIKRLSQGTEPRFRFGSSHKADHSVASSGIVAILIVCTPPLLLLSGCLHPT